MTLFDQPQEKSKVPPYESRMVNRLPIAATAEELKATGMKLAEDHANEKEPAWSEVAYLYLKRYCPTVPEFRNEQFAEWAEIQGLPKPPDARAYGSIMTRAARKGLIERLRIEPKANPKSHSAFASVWKFKGHPHA